MNLNISDYKKKIEKEIKDVESELSTVAKKNPDNPAEWVPTSHDMEVDKADENEVADAMEELGEDAAIMRQLEIRLNELNDALKRIKDGTYGICQVGGEAIEAARLNANPAAKTCQKHKDIAIE